MVWPILFTDQLMQPQLGYCYGDCNILHSWLKKRMLRKSEQRIILSLVLAAGCARLFLKHTETYILRSTIISHMLTGGSCSFLIDKRLERGHESVTNGKSST